MKIDAEVLMKLAEETGRKLCAERYDEILSLEDLEALVRKCQEMPARVIPAEELPATGTGWLDYKPTPAEIAADGEEAGLFAAAWAKGRCIWVDALGAGGTTRMEPDEEYGKTWRVWDRKPTPEERKAVAWE